jgi:hypothetical protein
MKPSVDVLGHMLNDYINGRNSMEDTIQRFDEFVQRFPEGVLDLRAIPEYQGTGRERLVEALDELLKARGERALAQGRDDGKPIAEIELKSRNSPTSPAS